MPFRVPSTPSSSYQVLYARSNLLRMQPGFSTRQNVRTNARSRIKLPGSGTMLTTRNPAPKFEIVGIPPTRLDDDRPEPRVSHPPPRPPRKPIRLSFTRSNSVSSHSPTSPAFRHGAVRAKTASKHDVGWARRKALVVHGRPRCRAARHGNRRPVAAGCIIEVRSTCRIS